MHWEGILKVAASAKLSATGFSPWTGPFPGVHQQLNDLESASSVFTDDTKIYRILETEDDSKALQHDLECLEKWSSKWLLMFDTNKCKTIHIGRNNQQADYQLNGSSLDKSTQEKDFGIIVSSDFKSSAHVAAIAAKANSRLGITKRNSSVLTKDMCCHFTYLWSSPLWTMEPRLGPLT